jgi:hypothetical protein
MTAPTEVDVARALLGTWPNQVAAWGREAIAAYCDELRHRDVTPAQALVAIRACPATQAFPPSVAELAGIAREAESPTPTFEEALRGIYGKGGIVRARPDERMFDTLADQARAYRDARHARAAAAHPLVGTFAVNYGVEELYHLPINDPEWGPVRRRELAEAWERHVKTADRRQRVAIAAGDRPRGLHQFDGRLVQPGPEVAA